MTEKAAPWGEGQGGSWGDAGLCHSLRPRTGRGAGLLCSSGLPQGTAASTKNKLPGLITSMETVGAKALEDFADNIKVTPSSHSHGQFAGLWAGPPGTRLGNSFGEQASLRGRSTLQGSWLLASCQCPLPPSLPGAPGLRLLPHFSWHACWAHLCA